jgi:hypothetical protein
LFQETQLITEGDEKLAITFSLVERQDQNAGKVVFGLFFLNKKEVTLEKYPAIWY